MAAARTVWFSFHLGCHRSAVSLSDLNVSPLAQTIAPMWGLDPCFSSPTGQRSSPTNTPVYPPSCFILRSFAWFYIFLPLVRYSCPLSAGILHMHFCVWRCIPDVSMERDVLYIHLPCHLVSSKNFLDGLFLKSSLNLLQYYFCFVLFFGPEKYRILVPQLQPGVQYRTCTPPLKG